MDSPCNLHFFKKSKMQISLQLKGIAYRLHQAVDLLSINHGINKKAVD